MSNRKLKDFLHLLDDSLDTIHKITAKNRNDTQYINNIIITHLVLNAGRYSFDKDFQSALQIYKGILQDFNDIIDIKNVLSIKFNMGIIYYNLNKFEQCKDFLEELYSEFSKTFKKDHISSLNIELYITNSYYRLKEIDIAVEYYEDLLPRYKTELGEYFIETLNLEFNLAGCYMELKNYTKSYNIFKTVHKKFKRETGKYSNFSILSKCFTGFTLARINLSTHQKEVKDIYEEIINSMDKVEDKQHILNSINFLEIKTYVANYYYLIEHDYNKSLNLYKEILPLFKQKTEFHKKDIIKIEENIAYCYIKVKLYENAIDKYKYILKTFLEHFNNEYIKKCNINIDFCKAELKKKYSGLNVKYSKILHNDLLNNTNGKEIYDCVTLSNVRLNVLIEKYQKYIGIDKIYNNIKTILESNDKVLKSFSKYANP